MLSNRIRNQSPPRRKRRVLRREKPRRGTLAMLLLLSVALIALVFFAPQIGLTPASNVSGTEVSEEVVSSGSTALVISEVMSSNRTAFPDETGAFPDWIELTNTGDTPIQLEGYGLSDRSDKITFIFPAMTLNPGEHVLVFA